MLGKILRLVSPLALLVCLPAYAEKIEITGNLEKLGANHETLQNSANSISQSSYENIWFVLALTSLFVLIILAVATLYYRKLFKEAKQKEKAKPELTPDEKNYRILFDLANDAIFLHNGETGKIEDVNQTTLDMYGYDSKEDFLSCKWDDISSNQKRFNQDAGLEKMSQANKDQPIVFEWLVQKKDGTEFWVEVNLKRITLSDGDKILALVRDIDEKRKAQQENINLRIYLTNLINSMPSAIIGVDVDGKIVHWNENALKLANSEEIANKKCTEEIELLNAFSDQINSSIHNQKTIPPLYHTVANQLRPQHYEILIYPLATEDFDGAVIRIDDITEKINMEEMMIQSEKMLSLGGLVAGVAHEINNPLAGMMQTADAIRNRIKSNNKANLEAAIEAGTTLDAVRQFLTSRRIIQQLETLHDAGVKTSEIVRSMLSFARKSALQFTICDPCSLMDESIDLFRKGLDIKQGIDCKNIQINRNYAGDLPVIRCDATKIRQVFFNLLKNGADAMFEACKNRGKDYTPTFDIKICNKGSGLVEITITDNGPGIPYDIQKHIFEPFFTTKKTGNGTGLGLSISYYIISQNHSGNMKIESEKDKGTSFLITLPVKQRPIEATLEKDI